MSHTFGNGGVMLDTPEDIERARLLALAGAMYLETKGMTHSHGSVVARVKREFGLKGNKQRVLDQFCKKFNLIDFQERMHARLSRRRTGSSRGDSR